MTPPTTRGQSAHGAPGSSGPAKLDLRFTELESSIAANATAVDLVASNLKRMEARLNGVATELDSRLSRLSESFESFENLVEVPLTQKLWEDFSTPVEQKFAELERTLESIRVAEPRVHTVGTAEAPPQSPPAVDEGPLVRAVKNLTEKVQELSSGAHHGKTVSQASVRNRPTTMPLPGKMCLPDLVSDPRMRD